MSRLYITLMLLLFLMRSAAQTCYIKGSVKDTLVGMPLYRSSITLIRTSDSVIQAYTRTLPDGSFALTAPTGGKYMLQITFPGFADYVDVITANRSLIDLGALPMVSKEHLLNEFVLTQQISAIKIKGDTTEYMADSFKVKDNATVEDLLKRLPGIQVDKNGQITAQGETVQKILVDGEEFFSDDPKVVTQGLQANAVEKVQVFDKKSDQAEFTGIDDGQKTKTINLKLKDDKKKGYFGKIDGGEGTGNYYQDQAMINAFKAKRQISAFAIASNTDKVGLGWADKDKFSSGNGVTEITDDGGIMTTWNNNDQDFGGWDGSYSGEGVPRTFTGGIHYADKWNEDMDHVTGNYRYAFQNVDITGDNTVQYILNGDSSNVSRQQRMQYSKGDRHAIDAMYEWKTDSNTTVKLTANAGIKNTQTSSEYNTTSLLYLGDAQDSLYTNNRNITSNTNADFINADLLLRHKFAKKGRTLSLDVKENYKDSKSNGQLSSVTNYIVPALDTLNSNINQRKANATHTLAFSAKATYIEPLSKITFLELDYGVTVNNSTSSNYSYDASAGGGYNTLDTAYSSNYKYNILSNLAGVSLRFVHKKINFSFGSDVSDAHYVQTDLLHADSASRQYDYINLFPKANFKYTISNQSSFTLSYNGKSQAPTINEIQPLKQNTDPTNIFIGNTALQQQFINTINAHYNDYRVLTSRYLWVSTGMSFINNDITTSQYTIDGINTTKYVNTDGNYNGWGYLGYGYKITKLDLNAGIRMNYNINHVVNYINGEENTSNNNSYTFGLDFNYYKQDKYSFNFTPGVSYNENTATINTFNTNYWSSDNNLSGSFQLPKNFEVGSNVDFLFRQKTVVFNTNNNVIKWNAYAGKKFLKKKQLELRASVFDILNQNIGYSRTANAGIITQNDYNTVKRYGMVNLIWNFTHTPAGAPAPPAGGVIMVQ
jgi:hypothetical protein